jgi:hypothetical protein
MSNTLDAQAMWNQYMGKDNAALTNNMDQQIMQLQQQYDRLKGGNAATGSAVPAEYQDLQKYIDPSTGKLVDPSAALDWEGNPAGKALHDQFMAQTGGSYGNGGFRQWASDALKNMQPKYEAFLKTKDVQTGNAATNNKAMQDLQNQIQYLTAAKTQYSGTGGQGTNPLSKYMTDLGPTFGTNPLASGWGDITNAKMASALTDPTAQMGEFGLGTGGAAGTSATNMGNAIAGIGQGQQMGSTALGTSQLDPAQAARAQEAADWQTGQEYTNQATNRDALAARRGMLNSSLSDMQRANDESGMIGARLQSGLNAATLGNQIAGQNFSQMAAANSQNNQFSQNATAQNNAQDLARKQAAISGYGSLATLQQQMGSQNYQNYLAGNQQNYSQAANALQNANAMRTEDYNAAIAQNATGYTRASDMWNKLNAYNQQQTQNNQSQQGLNTQATATNLQPQMQLADWTNQAGNANAQMQNAYNMQGTQNAQAQSNATNNMWGNILGAGLNVAGKAAGSAGSTDNGLTLDPSKTAGVTGGAGTPSYDAATGTWKWS